MQYHSKQDVGVLPLQRALNLGNTVCFLSAVSSRSEPSEHPCTALLRSDGVALPLDSDLVCVDERSVRHSEEGEGGNSGAAPATEGAVVGLS